MSLTLILDKKQALFRHFFCCKNTHSCKSHPELDSGSRETEEDTESSSG
ncbi:hypothetical protein [Candidatus Megaera venefica]|nr:hypothetical protein [Candidatus Megaera venefica]